MFSIHSYLFGFLLYVAMATIISIAVDTVLSLIAPHIFRVLNGDRALNYYPENDTKNSQLYAKYKALGDFNPNVISGGRMA